MRSTTKLLALTLGLLSSVSPAAQENCGGVPQEALVRSHEHPADGRSRPSCGACLAERFEAELARLRAPRTENGLEFASATLRVVGRGPEDVDIDVERFEQEWERELARQEQEFERELAALERSEEEHERELEREIARREKELAKELRLLVREKERRERDVEKQAEEIERRLRSELSALERDVETRERELDQEAERREQECERICRELERETERRKKELEQRDALLRQEHRRVREELERELEQRERERQRDSNTARSVRSEEASPEEEHAEAILASYVESQGGRFDKRSVQRDAAVQAARDAVVVALRNNDELRQHALERASLSLISSVLPQDGMRSVEARIRELESELRRIEAERANERSLRRQVEPAPPALPGLRPEESARVAPSAAATPRALPSLRGTNALRVQGAGEAPYVLRLDRQDGITIVGPSGMGKATWKSLEQLDPGSYVLRDDGQSVELRPLEGRRADARGATRFQVESRGKKADGIVVISPDGASGRFRLDELAKRAPGTYVLQENGAVVELVPFSPEAGRPGGPTSAPPAGPGTPRGPRFDGPDLEFGELEVPEFGELDFPAIEFGELDFPAIELDGLDVPLPDLAFPSGLRVDALDAPEARAPRRAPSPAGSEAPAPIRRRPDATELDEMSELLSRMRGEMQSLRDAVRELRQELRSLDRGR